MVRGMLVKGFTYSIREVSSRDLLCNMVIIVNNLFLKKDSEYKVFLTQNN